MELIVGTNSYVTLEEANNIISDNFTSTDDKLVYWNNLDDNDKKILINKITRKIDTDSMRYKGKKLDVNQKMQFPRLVDGKVVECPEDIKIGTLIQMLNTATRENSIELKLRDEGVKSFSDGGGASITFGDVSVNKRTINNMDSDVYYEFFNQYTIVI